MTFSFEDELNRINAALGIGRRGQSPDIPLAANEIPRSLLRQCWQCGRTDNVVGKGRAARCAGCDAAERQMYREQEARDRLDIDEREPDRYGGDE